jgi:hypothetical protein
MNPTSQEIPSDEYGFTYLGISGIGLKSLDCIFFYIELSLGKTEKPGFFGLWLMIKDDCL